VPPGCRLPFPGPRYAAARRTSPRPRGHLTGVARARLLLPTWGSPVRARSRAPGFVAPATGYVVGATLFWVTWLRGGRAVGRSRRSQRCRGVAPAASPDALPSRRCVPVRAHCVPKDLLQYGRARTHLVLAKDAPEPRSVHRSQVGAAFAVPEVNGFHHRYEWGRLE
jgi:hypothetical protein